jgi:hypothetical protein
MSAVISRLIVPAVVLFAMVLSIPLGATVAIASPRTLSCGVGNTKVKAISISSQVSGDRVKVCADWIKVSIRSKVSSGSKPTPRPKVTKDKGSTKSSGKSSSTKSVTPLNRSVVASADRPVIFSVPRDQPVPTLSTLLFSDATRHSKVRKLLGYNTLIRFTPVSYRWTTGDGGVSIRSRVRHRFLATGTYFVRLSVVYSIDLRVLPSGGWIKTPLTIKKVAEPLRVKVSSESRPQGVSVFVIHNCNQKPTAPGC